VFGVCFLLVFIAVACRSGPPPTSASNVGASRRQGVSGQYQGVIVIDPSCSQFTPTSDQVVCIKNKGKTPVAIGNWLIRNTMGRTYYFPEGTTIEPGKTIKLHTGAGTNTKTDLYWNYKFKPVFDGSDQVTLTDNSNVDIATFTVPSS